VLFSLDAFAGGFIVQSLLALKPFEKFDLSPFSGLPLVFCGGLKIVYDIMLLFSFRHIRPLGENRR
jgi:hypothetical protein